VAPISRPVLIGILLFGPHGCTECLTIDKGYERIEVRSQPLLARWTLSDTAKSVERAVTVSGLVAATSQSPSAFLAVMTEDSTPFLGGAIVGRYCWVVPMILPSGVVGSSFKGSERVFDVFLDAENGHLLKIVSRLPAGVAPPPALATPETAEKEMLDMGQGIYDGFPNDLPPVSFREALQTVEKESSVSVASAAQIIGQFVRIKTKGAKPVRCWVIMFRGVPPIRPYEWMPKTSTYQYRVIIDADTVKYLYLTNVPHPRQETMKRVVIP
jgi:hypothetical protein